jgi:hypothetical protein
VVFLGAGRESRKRQSGGNYRPYLSHGVSSEGLRRNKAPRHDVEALRDNFQPGLQSPIAACGLPQFPVSRLRSLLIAKHFAVEELPGGS